ncbi:ATP-binding protein [Patescibacteria group bacterium]
MLRLPLISQTINGADHKKRKPLCQKIFADSPLGIVIFDKEGKLFEANKVCTEIFGLQNDSSIKGFDVFEDPYLLNKKQKTDLKKGKSIKSLIPFEFGKRKKYSTASSIKKGEIFLDMTITPIYENDSKELCGYVAQFQNVTKRKNSEDALQERLRYEKTANSCINSLVKAERPSEAFQEILDKLVKVANVSRAYIFKIYEDNKKKYFMSQFRESVAEGIKPEIDNPVLQNLSLNALSKNVRNSILNNKIFSGVVRKMAKEDREILEAQDIRSIALLPIKVGDKIWGFIGFDDCVNERTWRDEDIHLLEIIASTIGTTISLVKERIQFRTMYNSIDETIYVADPDTHELLYVNKATEDAFGAVVGQKCYEAFHGKNTPCTFCTNNKIFGKNLGKTYIWESQNKKNKKWYKCLDRAIAWPNGKKVRYEMAIDITKQKVAEEEKKILEEQLNQAAKMEAIGTLAGGIAHDFNNILTIIMGSSQLAKMKLDPKSPLYHDLETIFNSSEKAAHLIKQLLAFSRKQVLQPKVLDINKFINEYFNILERMVEETIEIKFIPKAEQKNIKVDPGQLQQVIMNLAGNARDAMPNGGTITIKTSNVEFEKKFYMPKTNGLEEGSYVMLEISDTGEGMDDKTMNRIFEPFFTTKAPDKGTGLGLATSYGIVKQSGGDIHVESKVGKGATFKIYFPLANEEEEIQEVKYQTSIENQRNDATIMVVEDEDIVKELLCKTLEMAGYTVIDAANVDDAITKAKNEKIDCILTDIVMPKMSGPEMIKEIKEKTKTDPDVIYMSGYPRGHSSVNEIVKKDNEAYIQKPFRPVELLRKLEARLKTNR